MTLLSLFSGSGAVDLAAERYGITSRYMSEITPFPIAVTKARFPHSEHLGDIRNIDGGKIAPCDMVIFGSPCQDLSLAGKKAGLENGERSSLFFEATRIIREMLTATDNKFPKYILWENVKGALSSNKGQDFNTILSELRSMGFHLDCNILDAQEYGVAQRRQRIFLVGIHDSFFDSGLVGGFDTLRYKSLQAHNNELISGIVTRPHEPERVKLSEVLETQVQSKYNLSKEACEGILRRVDTKGNKIPDILRQALEYQIANCDNPKAFAFEPGALQRIGFRGGEEITSTLRAEMGDNQTAVAIPVESHPNDSRIKLIPEGEPMQTLSARMGLGGGNTPYVLNSAVAVQGSIIGRKLENGAGGKGFHDETAYTLDTVDIQAVAYGFTTGSQEQSQAVDVAPTLTAKDNTRPPCVTTFTTLSADTHNSTDGVGYSLTAKDYKDPPCVMRVGSFKQTGVDISPPIDARDGKGMKAVATTPYTIRRITPSECLTLMGLPKDYCEGIGNPNPSEEDMEFWRGVFELNGKKKSDNQIRKWLNAPYSDSSCYTMCGNGVVVNCIDWILDGLTDYDILYRIWN